MPSEKSQGNKARSKAALADALSGVAAALVALWVFYPIDVWKTHVQAGRKPPPLRRMMSSGLETKSLHTASSSFFYFYLYSWILSSWTAAARSSTRKVSIPTRLFLSAVAAMLNTCLTLPLDVISARHQTTTTFSEPAKRSSSMFQRTASIEEGDDQENENVDNEEETTTTYQKEEAFASMRQHVRRVNSFLGWKIGGLWKGLKPSLILCSNPAINYTVYDTIKSRYTMARATSSLSMAESFLLGLFSKFIATIATYPLIRAKVMLMVTSQKSMLQCLRQTYRERGVKGLYEGCDLQLLHTLLKSALLMMVRERISDATQRYVMGSVKQ